MSGSKVLQPSVSLALANVNRAVSNFDHKVLLVGQITSAGSAVDGQLNENLSATTNVEDALFGADSMLASMVRAFRAVNRQTQIDTIAVDDDGSGIPRVMTVTYVGTAGDAGTLTLAVGSERNHKFTLSVAFGATETTIAAAMAVLVQADGDCPFNATSVAGVLTLTAVNDGIVANYLGIEAAGTVAGITGMAVAQGTPGSVEPTLTAVLTPAVNRYQGIVWPWASDVATVEAFLDARFNPTNEVLDGVVFVSSVDSHSTTLSTLAARNSESVVFFCDKLEAETNYIGPSMNEPSYDRLAQFAAVRALRLTQDASISQFLTSSASRDQFGGPALASLPYFNTALPALSLIKTPRGWTELEIEQITAGGGAVIGLNRTGTDVIVGEVATVYKTDIAANPDPTFGFLNFVDTSSNIREYFFNNLKSRFAQSRLTDGDVVSGRDMANKTIIKAYCAQLYGDLSGVDFVLTQAGETALQYFKDNIVVVLDLALGKATITMFVPIVTQLRVIIGTVKIAFDTEG